MNCTIAIPNFRLVPLNRLMRMHHMKRWRQGNAQAELVAGHSLGLPRASGPRRVSLHFTLSGHMQEYDPDNVWKLLLDALVRCGMLVDDSRTWCQMGDITYDRAARPALAIALEDLESKERIEPTDRNEAQGNDRTKRSKRSPTGGTN